MRLGLLLAALLGIAAIYWSTRPGEPPVGRWIEPEDGLPPLDPEDPETVVIRYLWLSPSGCQPVIQVVPRKLL